MGSWSVYCEISKIAITSGQECVLLPLKEYDYEPSKKWQAATLPIFGKYNDYGGMEEIVHDKNTELIENHFGISIEEFVTFLVDGKNTYDRDEAKVIAKKMKNFEEAKEWRFMWIDLKVFNFMSNELDKFEKGKNNYGTKEMLELFGFKLVKKAKIKNYDPTRFNQLWEKDGVKFYSDGNTLLSYKENHYVYSFGKGGAESLETYFEVPKKFDYLKNLNSLSTWRLRSKENAFELLKSSLFPHYFFTKKIKLSFFDKKIFEKYFDDLDSFGDSMASLITIERNAYTMSAFFSPHVLYVTPQCGARNEHQILLEKFAEINNSYNI